MVVDTNHLLKGQGTSRSMQLSRLKALPTWKRWSLAIGTILLALAVIAFIAIWVIFPVVFMNTYRLQRYVVFWNGENPPNPEFNNPAKYNTAGAVNFYLPLIDTDGITKLNIGLWLVVQEKFKNSTQIEHQNLDTAAAILSKTTSPILISMHGVYCTRVMLKYYATRQHFLVIAPDHRGYGDSDGEPSEDGIISDSVQIFQWIRNHTKNDIYMWGHSLGSAITLHTVRTLKEKQNMVPKGVIIESAYTTLREEIPESSIGKIFSWLPYFNACVLDPIEKNGFIFKSTENILYVDSPLLMMHSEDDPVIPVKLGRRLAEVAKTQRNLTVQGTVTYLEFPAFLGYAHVGITDDKNMTNIVADFMSTCNRENKQKG